MYSSKKHSCPCLSPSIGDPKRCVLLAASHRTGIGSKGIGDPKRFVLFSTMLYNTAVSVLLQGHRRGAPSKPPLAPRRPTPVPAAAAVPQPEEDSDDDAPLALVTSKHARVALPTSAMSAVASPVGRPTVSAQGANPSAAAQPSEAAPAAGSSAGDSHRGAILDGAPAECLIPEGGFAQEFVRGGAPIGIEGMPGRATAALCIQPHSTTRVAAEAAPVQTSCIYEGGTAAPPVGATAGGGIGPMGEVLEAAIQAATAGAEPIAGAATSAGHSAAATELVDILHEESAAAAEVLGAEARYLEARALEKWTEGRKGCHVIHHEVLVEAEDEAEANAEVNGKMREGTEAAAVVPYILPDSEEELLLM